MNYCFYIFLYIFNYGLKVVFTFNTDIINNSMPTVFSGIETGVV